VLACSVSPMSTSRHNCNNAEEKPNCVRWANGPLRTTSAGPGLKHSVDHDARILAKRQTSTRTKRPAVAAGN
jgi:hypothetical protein